VGRVGVRERSAVHEQDQGKGRDQLLLGCSQTQYRRQPELLGWQSPKMAPTRRTGDDRRCLLSEEVKRTNAINARMAEFDPKRNSPLVKGAF
jgi:hypothetical protein